VPGAAGHGADHVDPRLALVARVDGAGRGIFRQERIVLRHGGWLVAAAGCGDRVAPADAHRDHPAHSAGVHDVGRAGLGKERERGRELHVSRAAIGLGLLVRRPDRAAGRHLSAAGPGVDRGQRVVELVDGEHGVHPVVRGDGTVLNYRVVKTQLYPADNVDMQAAITPVTAGKSGLNLITCAGQVKKGTSEFSKRVIVFAEQM